VSEPGSFFSRILLRFAPKRCEKCHDYDISWIRAWWISYSFLLRISQQATYWLRLRHCLCVTPLNPSAMFCEAERLVAGGAPVFESILAGRFHTVSRLKTLYYDSSKFTVHPPALSVSASLCLKPLTLHHHIYKVRRARSLFVSPRKLVANLHVLLLIAFFTLFDRWQSEKL
jgi:hypothetical protein